MPDYIVHEGTNQAGREWAAWELTIKTDKGARRLLPRTHSCTTPRKLSCIAPTDGAI